MSEPTLQELLAQQRAIGLALASHERPRVQAALDLFATEGAQAFVAAIDSIAAEMPEGQSKRMLASIQSVMVAVPNVLQQEATRLDAILAPPPAIPAQPPVIPPPAPPAA